MQIRNIHLIFLAAQLIFTLNAIGQTINLVGSDTVYLEVLKDAYVEQGYNAISNTGTNITSQVAVTSTIDTTKLGTYSVIYSITDSIGFITMKERIVIVRDTQKPIISTKTGRDTIDHQMGTPYNDEFYIEATDNYWGIPASSLQRIGTVNVNQQGIYTLRYNVTDSSGNAADEYTLRVFIRDLIAPTITLKGTADTTVDVFTNFADPGVIATDNISTPMVFISVTPEGLNINKLNVYTVTYTATDAFGNTSTAQRIVRVVDRVAPIITLKGGNPLRVDYIREEPKWWAEIEPGVIVIDNYYSEVDITIDTDSSTYSREVVGDYYVYYTAVDKSGNRSNTRFREVQLRFPVGIKELKVNTLTVYPNPSTGVFYINSKELKGATITVYDMTGREVLTQQISEGAEDTAIDMTGKMQGMYHMVLTHNGQSYHAKVTVMK